MGFPENDDAYEECVCDSIDGGSIKRSDGWSFFIDPAWPAQPRVGSRLRFYGRGIGYTVRGLYIDGQRAFYRTEAEQGEKDRQDQLDRDAESRAAFEARSASLDADYAALPANFQRRIDRFRRDGGPDWRWQYEAYEMSCCSDGARIAAALKTPEAIKAFREKPWDEQIKDVPGLFDGHSVNSFGFAVRLAWWHLTKPENVEREHGALVPLVGCEAYGCKHATAASGDSEGGGRG